MPNKENMRKWVEALRSGEFQQGQEKLKGMDHDGVTRYCCLGVALELMLRENLDPGWNSMYRNEEGSSYLTKPGMEWLGVAHRDPLVSFDPLVTAAHANDRLGWSFADIAAGVERAYELNEEDPDGR